MLHIIDIHIPKNHHRRHYRILVGNTETLFLVFIALVKKWQHFCFFSVDDCHPKRLKICTI